MADKESNKALKEEQTIIEDIIDAKKLQEKAAKSLLSSQSELINLHKTEKRILAEIAKAQAEGNENIKLQNRGLLLKNKRQQEFDRRK